MMSNDLVSNLFYLIVINSGCQTKGKGDMDNNNVTSIELNNKL